MADWRAFNETEIFYDLVNGIGTISRQEEGEKLVEKWSISPYELKILRANPCSAGRTIKPSEINEENGKWKTELLKGSENSGGEALVVYQKINGLEVAMRVQCFDPYLLTRGIDAYQIRLHFANDFVIAEDVFTPGEVTPYHENIIRHYCNAEILEAGEVVGWITIMEKCTSNMRVLLKEGKLNLGERKKAAIGVLHGLEYLKKSGIQHCDMKPENVLRKKDVAKIIDFGLIECSKYVKRRESYQKLGYCRRGTKFTNASYLQAATPGFGRSGQVLGVYGDFRNRAIYAFILCEWNTAWSLLFKPLESGQEMQIRWKLESFNAGWIRKAISSADYKPTSEDIQQLRGIIKLNDSSSFFSLDDPFLSKSRTMGQQRRLFERVRNENFDILTRNVPNQRDSNLCASFAVTEVLKYAIKTDMKINEVDMKEFFATELIMAQLTNIIYPRSLAGMNLNPNNREKQNQFNDIRTILRRLKNPTFLFKCGFHMIQCPGPHADFDYDEVQLHTEFSLTRPLIVAGACLHKNGRIGLHAMVCEKVENDEYVIQNNDHTHLPPLLRISRKKPYFMPNGDSHQFQLRQQARRLRHVQFERIRDFANFKKFVVNEDAILNVPLTSDYHEKNCNVKDCDCMKIGEWHLLDKAYSITLTPHHEHDRFAIARTSSIPVYIGNPDGSIFRPYE